MKANDRLGGFSIKFKILGWSTLKLFGLPGTDNYIILYNLRLFKHGKISLESVSKLSFSFESSYEKHFANIWKVSLVPFAPSNYDPVIQNTYKKATQLIYSTKIFFFLNPIKIIIKISLLMFIIIMKVMIYNICILHKGCLLFHNYSKSHYEYFISINTFTPIFT